MSGVELAALTKMPFKTPNPTLTWFVALILL
jgi:hypothetical protein